MRPPGVPASTGLVLDRQGAGRSPVGVGGHAASPTVRNSICLGGVAGCWGRTQGGGSILDLLKVRLDLLHHPWRQDIAGGKVDLRVGLGFGFGFGFG